MINCREDKSDQYGNECVVPTFGGCWEAGAGVVTVHTSMTWSMGGGTWSFTSQMSSLRNFVSRFKYSLSFSDSSTPVCSGLWLALQENCRELGLKMLTIFSFLSHAIRKWLRISAKQTLQEPKPTFLTSKPTWFHLRSLMQMLQ